MRSVLYVMMVIGAWFIVSLAAYGDILVTLKFLNDVCRIAR